MFCIQNKFHYSNFSIEPSLTNKKKQFELSEIISQFGLTFIVHDWYICNILKSFTNNSWEGATCLPRFWKIVHCYRLRHRIINRFMVPATALVNILTYIIWESGGEFSLINEKSTGKVKLNLFSFQNQSLQLPL